MMFVKTLTGRLVNLDHVVEIAHFETGRTPKYRCKLLSSEGVSLGEMEPDWEHEWTLTHRPAVFIPSWPNTKGIMLTYNDGEVDAEDCDILGWQVAPKEGEICQGIPVLIETPASNQRLLLRLPSGNLVDPDNAEFKTLEEAKEYFRKYHGDPSAVSSHVPQNEVAAAFAPEAAE